MNHNSKFMCFEGNTITSNYFLMNYIKCSLPRKTILNVSEAIPTIFIFLNKYM